MPSPRLRTVEKYKPPYPLNQFPASFAHSLGQEVVYLLATRKTERFEGSDWEESFARIIGGGWKPSNVGLDDVILEQTAWSAKTVKATTPSHAKRVRLICGRNSPNFSFGKDQVSSEKPNVIGKMVLSIWNTRVTAIRAKYEHLRSVVLIKSDDLLELAVFEFDTPTFQLDSVSWDWNQRGNLEGSIDGLHRFTWQPHGSQFTIIEDIPNDRLAIRIGERPPLPDMNVILKSVNFTSDWITVLPNRNDRNQNEEGEDVAD
jgi:hypothetical protein